MARVQELPQLSFWRLNKGPDNLHLMTQKDRERIEADPLVHGITLNHQSSTERAVVRLWCVERTRRDEFHAVSGTDRWCCHYDDLPAFRATSQSVWASQKALRELTEALTALPVRDSVTLITARVTTSDMRAVMMAENVHQIPVEKHYSPSPSLRILSHSSRFDVTPLVEAAARLERLLTMFLGEENTVETNPTIWNELTAQFGLVC